MRYQNLGAFQNHLKSAAPDHLSKCYLVAVDNDYERSVAIDAVLSYFKNQPRTVLNGADAGIKEISNALFSPSLFGGDPVVVIQDGEKMGKQEVKMLSSNLSNLYGYLICGVRSKTPLSSLMEKEGVVLDLLEEKPWDRDKRRMSFWMERAQMGEKRLAADALTLLLERVGNDPALVDREIDKLICYVGDRPTIERSDVLRICGESHTGALWKIAEELVWEGENPTVDPSMLHGLIPSLRIQLQMGLKISDLIHSHIPKEKWGIYLPKVWPKLLEKRIVQAETLGRDYFKSGLHRLFTIELLSRSGNVKEAALLGLFQYGRRR